MPPIWQAKFGADCLMVGKDHPMDAATISAIIEMALSDHITFAMIKDQHGLSADQVKALMRSELKPGSYRAWRKRVRSFGDRREVYK